MNVDWMADIVDPGQVLGLTDDRPQRPTPSPGGGRRGLSSSLSVTLTVIGAMAVGFLMTAGIITGRDVAQTQDDRRAELISLIEARSARVDALQAQLDELRAAVEEAERSAGSPGLQRTIALAEQQAGLTAVRGPGLRVVFDDARATCRSSRPEDCRIQDSDVQLAVNALFAAGAEAIAVNSERVIATTAVRGAGRSILVNYRVLSAPYVVEAVGDPDRMAERFNQSDLARDFAVWRDTYGLGFQVTPVDELVLPAYSGSVRLRAAGLEGDGT